MSPALLARLDRIASTWGLNRAATVRRLIEQADVADVAPLDLPTTSELLALAAERARSGNMSAVTLLLARQPDERQVALSDLLERLAR